MRVISILLSLLLFACHPGIAQTKMTNDEIIKFWSHFKEVQSKDDYNNFTFNEEISKRIVSIIDSLKLSSIDTIIIYTKAYPGYSSSDRCFEGLIPNYIYILWPSNNRLKVKLIKGKCEPLTDNIISTEIFDVYYRDKDIIETEIIMPVILKAEKTKEGRINYTMNSVNHEPTYSLHLRLKNRFKVLRFTQHDLQSEKSLFHQYNLNLKSIELWRLIEMETKDIPK